MLSNKVTFKEQVRFVFFYEDYFLDFYKSLNEGAQLKCEFVLHLIQTTDRVPSKFLKHITGTSGLYEIRVEYESIQMRIFAFFEEMNRVIILNGCTKKSQKILRRELLKAKQIQRRFYEENRP